MSTPQMRRIAILGMSLFLLLCGSAMARPRDEAMARAYRCAAQPATRVWLDCYYGAAQPVRAALGMPQVPPAQAQLSEVSPTADQVSDVALRDRVMADAGRCAGLAEDRGWLDCFYAATNPVRTFLALPLLAAGPVLASTAPAPSPPQHVAGILPDIFGATVVQAHGRMASYSYDSKNNFTVTLDNGQVWRQLDGDAGVSHWHEPAGNYQVTVTNGAFGSHNLAVKGSSGIFKVKRIS
jgi:hypothetical protein